MVGEDVFFELWEDGKTRILHTRFGEEPNVLLEDLGAHFVGLTVTADTLTWLRAPSDGSLSRAERMDLYTSPYATRAEDITPRFVANYLPDHATGYDPNVVGGEGFFTAFRAPFFRLSDGSTFMNPPGLSRDVVSNIGYLWMSGGEVAISALLNLEGGRGTGTLRRLQLDRVVPEDE